MIDLSVIDYVVAGGAAVLAGGINAVAGGGTLVSFPALLAIGVPSVSANVTNTVALCPGYLGGAWAQRADLEGQQRRLRSLLPGAAVGGLLGSILLVTTSDEVFSSLVPWLIIAACLLLAVQDRVGAGLALGAAARVAAGAGEPEPEVVDGQGPRAGAAATVGVSLAAVYGGYFGAGLGIMVLAVLGVLIEETLTRLNAVKQWLSLVINVVAALFFVFSGKVEWRLAVVMAVGSLVGGNLGGRVAGRLDPRVLRVVVVAFGLVVAGKLLVA